MVSLIQDSGRQAYNLNTKKQNNVMKTLVILNNFKYDHQIIILWSNPSGSLKVKTMQVFHIIITKKNSTTGV